MTSYKERLEVLCKRLDVDLRLDRNGQPDVFTLALIGVKLLREQREFQCELPAHISEQLLLSNDARPEDLKMVQAVEQAANELRVDFERILDLALPLFQKNNWLPSFRNNNDRMMHAERLLRLKLLIDTERTPQKRSSDGATPRAADTVGRNKQ